ncbi:MAG: class I tRNA ligase family protein, partial [Oscillospiraceae bacterium]|nr:class I tRNA ligase family protein [Oscillospiraceae bacterium]
ETDTMPQWAGSSWYFLRYIDPRNDQALADPEKLKYWLPVDWYNGGMEHVTRHMIYSRFWHRFLYDIGAVPCEEPYAKRTAQGLVLGANGVKMSKSLGNVVDPNDVVDRYGADVLRTYVLFMGDYEQAAPWSDSSVRGCKRLVERFAALTDLLTDAPVPALVSPLHRTIRKVSEDIETMKFNTAIAAIMTFVNDIYAAGSIDRETLLTLTKLLCPFAPHICEEMWQTMGETGFCSAAEWPTYDEEKTKEASVEIAVQICGKVRGRLVVPAEATQEEVLAAIQADASLSPLLSGKQIVKQIYVPGRLFNLVVK